MLRTFRDYFQLKRFTPDASTLIRSRRRHAVGQVIPVRVTPGAGLEAKVDLRGGTQDVSVFFEIFARDAYRLGQIPGRLGTVIDLGGNVGLFTLRAAGIAERVLCFEPMLENFERLSANTAGLNHVERNNLAVGANDGMLSIFFPATARGTGRFSAQPQAEVHDAGRKIDVECIRLDTLFARHKVDRCDLLKIDIEGSEYDVLLNASGDTLAKIQRIYGEFHPCNDPPDALGLLKARLEQAGFRTRWEPQPNDSRYGMFFASRG